MRGSLQVHAPSGVQMWSQQNIQQEAHFNLAAHGPGAYKVW